MTHAATLAQHPLRRALLLDAVASGAMGALLAAGAGPLAGLLGLPAELLRGAGLFLLPFAACVAFAARRPQPARPAALAVIGVNVLWAVDSVLLLAGGWVAPTALGAAFVLAQAVTVAAFAALQWVGLRRSASPAAR